jgi:hypothetical protein
MSIPAALKTTRLVNTFISGLSPLLRTANLAARKFELLAGSYRCLPSTTRLGKYCPPRYRARFGDREDDEIDKQAACAWFPATNVRETEEPCRKSGAPE